MNHVPVLLEETMKYLSPQKKKTYVDATLGFAGHTREILKRAKGSNVIGFERDGEVARMVSEENIPGLTVVHASYEDIGRARDIAGIDEIEGVLFDFGINSWHVDASGRGFSFQNPEEPLDMRFMPGENGPTATEILNTSSQDELVRIFTEYGEEQKALSIAKRIITARRKRRIVTVGDLLDAAFPKIPPTGKHPATKVFQALRIAVNHELDVLRRGLEAAMDVVTGNGVVVAISFHSLEDRIVKDVFRSRGEVITKKVVTPAYKEVQNNPRARSAKLRAWRNV